MGPSKVVIDVPQVMQYEVLRNFKEIQWGLFLRMLKN